MHIYLNTGAIEPDRWSDRADCRYPYARPPFKNSLGLPSLRIGEWVEKALEAGFDGVELWEPHAVFASERDLSRLESMKDGLCIYNGYFPLTSDPEAVEWRKISAEIVNRFAFEGVKYNFVREPGEWEEGLRNLRDFAAAVPGCGRILCEGHSGNTAGDPEGARRLADGLEDPRHQFIVHPFGDKDPETWLSLLGDRVTHAHIWRKQAEVPMARGLETLKNHHALRSATVEFTSSAAWGGPFVPPETLFNEAVRDMNTLREHL